ncbi:N-acyl homoserine lactonase family protein [Georgenia sp. SYP-B2076]|uniref:N-acyl homoserine lactonase family protein n=1 Tax=Georgenia sp. SYP-B2076 TaxID=2495881 RepID=UPI00197A8FAD|nr:N-acyl homoserine lactonase family protein [Georgenia sp. SYP-B2076]
MTPTTAARLWALDAPRMNIDAAHLVVGAEGTVSIPLPAFLIEHEQGLVLFDTGMSPLVCEDPALVFGDRPETAMIESNPEQRIDTQLGRLGYRPEDITHVVLSHTHSDHAGGLYLFPQAKFYIGPEEFRWARGTTNQTDHLFNPADLNDEVKEFDWHEVGPQGLDLFGDGAINVLHTPGHTPGELSSLVRLPSQNIVLTGDTVHLREGMEWDEVDPSDWDYDEARRSIAALKNLQETERAKVWISHDPRDWEDFGGPLKALE